MSGDMLMSFESPAAAKNQCIMPNRNGLTSPLIPCPSTPFDLVPSRPGEDPFELEPQNPFGLSHDANSAVKISTQEPSTLAPPTLDIPVVDAATPSPLLLRRAMSDVDISGVVPGQYLISSTPLVSNANTPTRSSRTVPRRSVLESISCALVKSKLDFINKVKQDLAAGDGNHGMNRSKSVSNLAETHDTSVQHKIFSAKKAVVSQDKNIATERRVTNVSSLMDSSKANFSSVMRDPDELTKHETSTLLSFLTSPKHVMIGTTLSSEDLCREAKKMQRLFSLCAHDDHVPAKEEEGVEWFSSALLPDAWFDDRLDLEDILDSDSDDEDVTLTKHTKRMSTQEEMEAIKVRLNRFRRSSVQEEDKLVKEPKEDVPTVKSNTAAASACITGVTHTNGDPAAKVEEVKPVEAPPVAVPPLAKFPIIPDKRPKASNPVIARKGPLKAVEPVPNMIKKSHSSDMLKTKPALVRGRQARPSSEQGLRRQDSPASRRSNSISPKRSASTPPVKNLRPPVKLPGVKKTISATGGKGKENRV